MRSSVLVGAALALLFVAPAQAAPELTLTASHARDPLLRAQAPNTTLQPAVLTLARGQHRRGPDGRQRRHRDGDAAGRAERAGQQPGRWRRPGRRLRPGLDVHRRGDEPLHAH